MKSTTKIFALALAVLMLFLSGCSLNKSASEPSVSISSLSEVKTKAELAAKLDCDVENIENIIVYAKNLSKVLPDTDEEPDKSSFKRGVTEDEGLTWLTAKEIATMVTPVVISTENWKDYFVPTTKRIKIYNYDENDNETITYEDEACVAVIDGYCYDSFDYSLTFRNNTTGHEFEYTGSWEGELSYKDGKIYYTDFNDDNGFSIDTIEFDINNYTCIKANMIIYKYDIDESLLYRDEYSEEDGEYKNYSYPEVKDKYDIDETFICVNTGTEESPDVWHVGYAAIGDFVFGR